MVISFACTTDGLTEPSPDIGATLEAVDAMIPALKERGLRFETVSQILCPTELSHARDPGDCQDPAPAAGIHHHRPDLRGAEIRFAGRHEYPVRRRKRVRHLRFPTTRRRRSNRSAKWWRGFESWSPRKKPPIKDDAPRRGDGHRCHCGARIDARGLLGIAAQRAQRHPADEAGAGRVRCGFRTRPKWRTTARPITWTRRKPICSIASRSSR